MEHSSNNSRLTNSNMREAQLKRMREGIRRIIRTSPNEPRNPNSHNFHTDVPRIHTNHHRPQYTSGIPAIPPYQERFHSAGNSVGNTNPGNNQTPNLFSRFINRNPYILNDQDYSLSTLPPQNMLEGELNPTDLIKKIREISYYLFKLIDVSFGYFLFFLLFYMTFLYSISTNFLILPIILIDVLLNIYSIVRIAKYYDKQERYYFTLELIENSFEILFKLFILMKMAHLMNYYCYLIIPLLICLFARIFLSKNCGEQYSDSGKLISSLSRIFVLFTTITVCLKLDNIINWPWLGVIWPYWVVLSFLGLFSIAIIVITCGAGFHFVKGRIDSNEFFITLWIFYSIVGFTFTSLAFVINLLKYFEGEQNSLPDAVCIPIFYLPILVIFSLLVYTKIPSRAQLELSQRQAEAQALSQSVPPTEERRFLSNMTQDQREKYEKFKKKITTPVPKKPNFIMKLSSSYFRRIDQAAKNLFHKIKAPKSSTNKSGFNDSKIPQIHSSRESKLREIEIDDMDPSTLSMRNPPNNESMLYMINEERQSNGKLSDTLREDRIQITITKNTIEKRDQPITPDMITKMSSSKVDALYEESKKMPGTPSRKGFASQRYQFIRKSERNLLSERSENKFDICNICFDHISDAVLMECGHGAICFRCGAKLLLSTAECHLCREVILQVLKIDVNYTDSDFLKVLEAVDRTNARDYLDQERVLED